MSATGAETAGAGPVARRRDQLAAALARVQERVAAACAEAGRSRAEVTIVVVTKTFPASDVALLAGLGVREVGENRDQEARHKVEELAVSDDPGVRALRWHFIGQLQRNKAASVARYADVVHSVDRPQLATALDRGASSAGRTLEVLLQVDLDVSGAAAGRGGCRPEDVAALADAVAATQALRLKGLMAVAPLGEDPRAAFERLRAQSAALRADHPGATWVSAGMSGDLEAAVACGATHLRVGSAVLGSRPSLG